MEEILKTPNAIAAIITGSIAMIGVIVQIITFIIKHNHEGKSGYEKVLQEKIERAYSPILFEFDKIMKSNQQLNVGLVELIKQNSHLFSSELLSDLRELIRLESCTLKENEVKEYGYLREKIYERISKEYGELLSKYNQHFNEVHNRIHMKVHEKVRKTIIKASVFLTIIYIVFMISLLLLDYLQKNIIKDNSLFGIIFSIWTIIALFTAFCFLAYLLGNAVAYFLSRILGDFYLPNNYVPETQNYYCSACLKEYKFYKHSKFSYCKDHNLLQQIKYIFAFVRWIECNEKYYEKISKRKSKHEKHLIKVLDSENRNLEKKIMEEDSA